MAANESELARRVTVLEELVAHLDRTLEQLNEVALDQARELVAVRQELSRLKLQLGLLATPDAAAGDDADLPDSA